MPTGKEKEMRDYENALKLFLELEEEENIPLLWKALFLYELADYLLNSDRPEYVDMWRYEDVTATDSFKRIADFIYNDYYFDKVLNGLVVSVADYMDKYYEEGEENERL